MLDIEKLKLDIYQLAYKINENLKKFEFSEYNAETGLNRQGASPSVMREALELRHEVLPLLEKYREETYSDTLFGIDLLEWIKRTKSTINLYTESLGD